MAVNLYHLSQKTFEWLYIHGYMYVQYCHLLRFMNKNSQLSHSELQTQ